MMLCILSSDLHKIQLAPYLEDCEAGEFLYVTSKIDSYSTEEFYCNIDFI
jgi:hypothetical protein